MQTSTRQAAAGPALDKQGLEDRRIPARQLSSAWAKRSVQAALVTGGMIAVGTGVASASENCPDRSALSPASDDALRDLRPCFAGELFPGESAQPERFNRSVASTGTRVGRGVTMSGRLDPVRDLLPAMENDVTREMPALRDEFWMSAPAHESRVAAPHVPEPVGWFTETVKSTRQIPLQPDALMSRPALAGLPPLGTPAEGFHRSLSWAGPIGDVVSGEVKSQTDSPLFRQTVAPELVVPSGDPAVAEGFDQVDSIVELWQGALGKTSDVAHPLLEASDIDLTSGALAGPVTERFDVPHSVVAAALSRVPRAAAVPQDFVPLQVPGDFQEKATDVPDLSRLPLVNPADRSGQGRSGVQLPLPGGGDLHAFNDAQTSVPAPSRITQALDGAYRTPRWASHSRELPDLTFMEGHTMPMFLDLSKKPVLS